MSISKYNNNKNNDFYCIISILIQKFFFGISFLIPCQKFEYLEEFANHPYLYINLACLSDCIQ